MTLQQLRYLVAIADSGLNITAAAQRLHTSQPSISKQLKLLEQELGVPLFTRKGKSLATITPAGGDVIVLARRIVREAEKIRTLARDLSGEQEGTLSIATTHTQARHVLPDVITEFRERYPKINLELREGTAEQLVGLVAANRVDFVIASGSRQLFPGHVLLPCFRWDRIIVVPNGHPLIGSNGLTLSALARYPLAICVSGTSGESSLRRAFAEQGLEPNVIFAGPDVAIIKTYVRLGMGVGIVAPMVYECDDRRDLAAIPAAALFPRATTWLGFRRDSILRRHMVEFVALFAPHLTPQLMGRAARSATQAEVDALFDEELLPVRV